MNDLARAACSRIAPAWPLDRSIAVNPFWGWIDLSLAETSNRLAGLMGTCLTMPAEYYAGQSIRPELLDQAARRAGLGGPGELFSLCQRLEQSSPPALLSIAHYLDLLDHTARRRNWMDRMVRSISSFCAAYFDRGQSEWKNLTQGNLYRSWLQDARSSQSMPDFPDWSQRMQALPDQSSALLQRAGELLLLEDAAGEAYLTALLLELNGWASWCAFEDWEQSLRQNLGSTRLDFLCIRLAWDLLLWQGILSEPRRQDWRRQTQQAVARLSRPQSSLHWLLQEALEQDFQSQLNRQLQGPPAPANPSPDFQFVFCIDVRSEPMRRTLEGLSPRVQTLGFAGFFGLPAAFQPAGAQSSIPHLPGLLAPQIQITEVHAPETDRSSQVHHAWCWRKSSRDAISTFSFIESLGLFSLWPLLKDVCGMVSQPQSTPPLRLQIDGTPALDLAERILRGMSLLQGFAPSVLLVGHEASCQNNPQAAGLQCGACGGQSGEVSAVALAELLNRSQVRLGLQGRGIDVPDSTRFYPAVHNTTLNRLSLCASTPSPPPELFSLLEQARQRLADPQAPRRSRSWAETRPEWGLINNAALIAAPRATTYGKNLEGRVFLHEYQAALDPDGAVLEQIMTAPMVVAHWINLQYFASTVDPVRWGSGDKTLHNVVGGGIGLYEGSGGDLRIGLARQSLHDGSSWRHAPLRLSVWLEAETSSIDRILARHPRLQRLLAGQWLFLFSIHPHTHQINEWRENQWQPIG